MPQDNNGSPVALITGAAKRIGAQIAQTLHAEGMDVLIHYNSSAEAAQALKQKLEAKRPDSVHLVQADLLDPKAPTQILEQLEQWRGRLNLLVNNASAFYPTPIGSVTEEDWNTLFSSNLKAPFFLAQAVAPYLKASQGAIVNLVDIYAERPLKTHPVYSMAKAGNAMMVKSLAKELGPEVRVNGIAPGAILWPEEALSEEQKTGILNQVPLQRPGSPEDIARTVLFLGRDADYLTGQIVAVDGGRSVSL